MQTLERPQTFVYEFTLSEQKAEGNNERGGLQKCQRTSSWSRPALRRQDLPRQRPHEPVHPRRVPQAQPPVRQVASGRAPGPPCLQTSESENRAARGGGCRKVPAPSGAFAANSVTHP